MTSSQQVSPRARKLRALVPLLVAAACLFGTMPALAQSSPSDASLQQSLDDSLAAFNRGDFEGYLHDVMPRVSYNELTVERKRMVEINSELAKSFPDLAMSYKKLRINTLSADEATAAMVSEFKGSTGNYEGSGMPATYREEGQMTSLYQRVNGKWMTGEMQVAWDDSYIDIGRDFGTIGFSSLPTLVGSAQPYSLRLYAGTDETPGVGISYAYAIAPLSIVLEKAGAERLFNTMKFKLLSPTGLDTELKAPKEAGTYAHILVINKFMRTGNAETLLGQKIYSRLVRVEE
jgi:hypothetical protein